LKKYVTLAKLSMQSAVAYRGSFIISMLGSIFLIVSTFYLWKAIYSGRTDMSGFSWDEMKTYLFIAFIANSLMSFYSEGRIGGRIRSGEVATDLLKPLDFQNARFAEILGISIFEGGITVIMAGIVLVAYSGVMLPHDVLTWALFIISLLLSIVVKFGVVYLFGLCCFWTDSVYGISLARSAVTNLLSGALVPIVFFPDWLQTLSFYLPFQAIVHVPSTIYLGHAAGMQAVQMIGVQALWGIALWVIGKMFWNAAVRQVTIYGG
jgi:ABC-2 type transport system permease protein